MKWPTLSLPRRPDVLEAELAPPRCTEPCVRCGHPRQAHGADQRDTSCTDCTCIEWKAP